MKRAELFGASGLVGNTLLHVSRQEIDGNHMYPSDEISRLAPIRK